LLLGYGGSYILANYKDVITTIIPELKPCIGFNQNNRYHEYDVYDHIRHAVYNYGGSDLVVIISLLLHDIGKPHCYTEDCNGGHFYGHGVVSHDIAEKVLDNLRFDNKTKHDVLELVLYHDSTIEPTPKTVRRWLNKIGEKQFLRLLDIREADMLAHSKDTQKSRLERNDKLRKILAEIIQSNQCFTIKDLAINGKDIIAMGVPEGKRIGEILNTVLNEVINETIVNERKFLLDYVYYNLV